MTESERYQEYLCGRKWGLLRARIKERCNGICERCHSGPMTHVHHLTYARKYHELAEDLEGLCEACHEHTHAINDSRPTMNEIIPRDCMGILIPQRKMDGYWDAEAMCAATDPPKRWADYWRFTGQEYALALSNERGIPVEALVERNIENPVGAGVWIDPDIAHHLATWLSAAIAVRVFKWIKELMETGSVSIRPPQDLSPAQFSLLVAQALVDGENRDRQLDMKIDAIREDFSEETNLLRADLEKLKYAQRIPRQKALPFNQNLSPRQEIIALVDARHAKTGRHPKEIWMALYAEFQHTYPEYWTRVPLRQENQTKLQLFESAGYLSELLLVARKIL